MLSNSIYKTKYNVSENNYDEVNAILLMRRKIDD